MKRHRRGFTLIELLVVIAIIAILAAMLFPVFARARESARKIQCLSNVKNIATAVQMYLVDYDRFPPDEHRPEVVEFFNNWGGVDCCCRDKTANPYLRWPVILDEYTKNRDVWRCPSARMVGWMAINPCPGGDWFGFATAHTDAWGCYGGFVCHGDFPPGWGGSVTDSVTQQTCVQTANEPAGSRGGFEFTIGHAQIYDLKTSQVGDPARFYVVSDSGAMYENWDSSTVAYPDVCGLRCAGVDWGPRGDWINCSWTQECAAWDPAFWFDPDFRKNHPLSRPRHLGGVNVGFADGHAQWMSSERVLKDTIDYSQPERTDWAITGGLQQCSMQWCLRQWTGSWP